jgi:ABC-type uncharacterized transport system permease subunit
MKIICVLAVISIIIGALLNFIEIKFIFEVGFNTDIFKFIAFQQDTQKVSGI